MLIKNQAIRNIFDEHISTLLYLSQETFLLRITDEGLVPEMRIWSILFIKSYLKWRIHLSRSLFLYTQQQQLRTAYSTNDCRGKWVAIY